MQNLKKKLFLFSFLFLFAGCSTSKLEIRTPLRSWTPKLNVELLLQTPSGQSFPLIYQEDFSERDMWKDSLIVDQEPTSLSLAAYVQEEVNQLKLLGYHLVDEKTEKKQIRSQKKDYPVVIKKYVLQLDKEQSLYLAQLFVATPDAIQTISYASDLPKNTKRFISQLDSIQFVF